MKHINIAKRLAYTCIYHLLTRYFDSHVDAETGEINAPSILWKLYDRCLPNCYVDYYHI